MSTEVYYFTSTGNSLATARAIAEKTEGRLIPIPTVMNRADFRPEADAVGIVFPVYYATNGESGMPLIVGRFIEKLTDIGAKYIFAVCTHDGLPGATMANLSRAIQSRGGELAVGFTLKMRGISASLGEKLSRLVFHQGAKDTTAVQAGDQQLSYRRGKIDTIVEAVKARKRGILETRGPISRLAWAPLMPLTRLAFMGRYRSLAGASRRLFSELIPLADRSFRCDAKCNGCAICARVCPVGNIEMVEMRPQWRHHCETCYACYQWCPKEAIHGNIVAYNKRGHHPGVALSDMLR